MRRRLGGRAAVIPSRPARRDNGDNTALVASANGLNLREGPGTNFPTIVTLKNKSVLQLLGRDGVWLQVTALDSQGRPDKTGWVHSHYVALN